MIAFVGIDRGGITDHQFRRMRHPTGQEPAKQVRTLDAGEFLITGKRVFAIFPQAKMDVATGTGMVVGIFGHERHADALRIGNFLDALFIDALIVGHSQDVGVAHIQFVLPESPFPFGAFDRNSRP